MTAVKEKSTRREKGEALHAAGAVEVVEEWTRRSAAAPYAPVISGGRYVVEGTSGRHELTVDAPPLGAPCITCECEDYRRGNAPNGRCKHALAVFEHIRAANRDMEERLGAVRRHKATRHAAENVPA